MKPLLLEHTYRHPSREDLEAMEAFLYASGYPNLSQSLRRCKYKKWDLEYSLTRVNRLFYAQVCESKVPTDWLLESIFTPFSALPLIATRVKKNKLTSLILSWRLSNGI